MQVRRLTSETVEIFKNRVNQLTADSPRKWGTMSAAAMLRHLRHLLELSLSEVEVKDQSNVFTKYVVRPIAFHVLPDWPKGKIKAPDHLTPKAEDFDQERQKLIAAFDRFVDAVSKSPDKMALHPLFGSYPIHYWAFLHGRHFEHHFRQFGV